MKAIALSHQELASHKNLRPWAIVISSVLGHLPMQQRQQVKSPERNRNRGTTFFALTLIWVYDSPGDPIFHTPTCHTAPVAGMFMNVFTMAHSLSFFVVFPIPIIHIWSFCITLVLP